MEKSHEGLGKLHKQTEKVDLHYNAKKTELQANNHEAPVEGEVKGGQILQTVDNFKCIRSWIQSFETDLNAIKALDWTACHKLQMYGAPNYID